MNKNTGVAGFLLEHAELSPVSFHMPGHKGSRFYRENGYGIFLDRIADCDITEIPGADNLFQAEGIIKETMNRYKAIYGVKDSFLLINGSSSGLIAAILTAVPEGGTLIMARNCHKSVYNGLRMAGAKPVYAYPEELEDFGISGEVTPEEIRRCLREHPEASAVILPSPNYYGICSDIEAIGRLCHEAGKILIVDQAHGAHLKLFDSYIGEKRLAAENLGADIIIESTHKTLASFTQSAVANLNSERIDRSVFEDRLQLIESTSPSYLLMASLDINAELLEKKGRSLIFDWEDNLKHFYEGAEKIEGLNVLRHPMLDHTKINLDMSRRGVSGLELEQLLMDQGIFTELVTGDIVMCMTGIGNKRCDFDRLLSALQNVAERHPLREESGRGRQTVTLKKPVQAEIPKAAERVRIEEAAGRICAAAVIPYPPGIPVICPGEIMDGEILDYVKELRAAGEKVMGVDEEGFVVCGKEICSF
ncbi:MAG: aminotransferase class I/II-fold pyridoxal phosphate-dependent enzyme [Emergencia sp.]